VVEIMQYLDQGDIANAWDYTQPYASSTTSNTGQPVNAVLSNTALNFLRCPDDLTAQPNQPNLSYVVNGGFTLFHATGTGFYASQSGGSTVNLTAASAASWPQGVVTRMGVMFPGTVQGNLWDYKTAPTTIQDGASNTILISENTQGGYDPAPSWGTPHPGWSSPLPQYVTFIGSAHICDGAAATATPTGTCDSGVLTGNSATGVDGVGWKQASF
jgi:hypothetical protein